MNTEESTPLKNYPFSRSSFETAANGLRWVKATDEQKRRIKDLEGDFEVLIQRILESSPPGIHQDRALEKLWEVAFYVKKAICLEA